jgi:hypothetical protein
MGMFNFNSYMTGKIKQIEHKLDLICDKLDINISKIHNNSEQDLEKVMRKSADDFNLRHKSDTPTDPTKPSLKTRRRPWQ